MSLSLTTTLFNGTIDVGSTTTSSIRKYERLNGQFLVLLEIITHKPHFQPFLRLFKDLHISNWAFSSFQISLSLYKWNLQKKPIIDFKLLSPLSSHLHRTSDDSKLSKVYPWRAQLSPNLYDQIWTNNSGFMYFNQKTGYHHLYLYSAS